MFCSKCGEKNPDEARFCGKCGASLSAAAPAPAPQAPPGSGAAPVVASNTKLLGVLGAIFIPFLGIVLGILFMNDPNPAKKSVGRLWLFLGIGMLFVWGLVGACVEAMANASSSW